jgi:hypothetical protein
MGACVRWLVNGTACLVLLVASGSNAGAQEPAADPVRPAIEAVSDAVVARIKAALDGAPTSRLTIPANPSVATFHVKVEGDYAAEFQASLRGMWEFSDEEKKLIRATSPGGGIDPLILYRALFRLSKKMEARAAREEVEALMEQLELAAAQQGAKPAEPAKPYIKH